MKSKTPRKSAEASRKAQAKRITGKPTLLAGGNPQIAKADGDAAVRSFIEAMPGWKREVGRRLDSLIVRAVPEVRKAVRWNSPFYGVKDRGWFLSFHCVTKYIKVAFFNGTALRPPPPVDSRNEGTRYFHIHEEETLDEALVTAWIRQASALPSSGKWGPSAGWVP